jgi:putative endonuclease
MSEDHRYVVSIMASKPDGTLYTAVTGDLPRRTYPAKHDLIKGFTSHYGVHTMVWFAEHGDANAAIAREKQSKGPNRAWEIRRLEEGNPAWQDLFDRMVGYMEIVIAGRAAEDFGGKGAERVKTPLHSWRHKCPRRAVARLAGHDQESHSAAVSRAADALTESSDTSLSVSMMSPNLR